MAMFNEDKNLKSGGCADEIAALIRDDLSPKMIQEQLENYHNSDIAKSMEQMDRLGRMRLIRSIEPDKLAGIFKYVEPQEAAAFLKDIDTARAVFILEKIDPDAAADILRELPGSDRSAMIGLLNGALRKKIELLVSFDEDEIGSRMSANFISLDSEMTVGRATRALMDQAKENDNIQMLFVTAENGFFCGTVELRALLIAEKNAAIAPLIQHRFPYVYCSERTEDCIERLKSYAECAIPALDASNCILGVITLKDLVEAVDDEIGEDYAQLAGLTTEEDLGETVTQSMIKGLPWLLILLGLGLVVSTVTGMFEQVLIQFPLREIRIAVPDWLSALDEGHWLAAHVLEGVRAGAAQVTRVGDYAAFAGAVADSPFTEGLKNEGIDVGLGRVRFSLPLKDGLFNRVLGEECGCDIHDDFELISAMKGFVAAKAEYDRISGALEEAWCIGTAAVISPIGALGWDDVRYEVNNGQIGALSQKLYDELTGILWGTRPDPFGWTCRVSE